MNEDGQKYLVLKGVAGFGNRLSAFLEAIIYAKITGRKLIIDWTDGVYAPKGVNPFFEFFECSEVSKDDVLPNTNDVFPQPWVGKADSSVVNLVKTIDASASYEYQLNEIRSGLSIDVNKIDYPEKVVFFYDYKFSMKYKVYSDKLPSAWKFSDQNDFINFLISDSLHLKKDIKDRIEEFKKNNFKNKVIGVHIRYTDNLNNNKTGYGSLDNYKMQIDKILQEHPDATIFLATDNIEVLNDYKHQYKNVVHTEKFYPENTNQAIHRSKVCKDRVEMGREALVDMYLLSECDYLIFYKRSSFGRFASRMADQNKVKLIDIEQHKQKIYVSLTTISGRINNVRKVIDSILDQTRKVDGIKLYISREPFLLDNGIPENQIPDDLKSLQDMGLLDIIYTENIGSYRKLLPLLKEKRNEDCIIITADDDVIYPKDWTIRFIEASERKPKSVVSFRNRYIGVDENCNVESYQYWPAISKNFYLKNEIIENRIFPTGRGGILYKPSFFNDIVFDEKFTELCPSADDIWFRFSILANGIGSSIAFSDYRDYEFKEIIDREKINLHKFNLNKNHPENNDSQFMATANYFLEKYRVDILKLITSDKKDVSMVSRPQVGPLTGTIWGITTFFNPVGYKNKYENYRIFREQTKKQSLKLLVVELVFGNQKFELSDDDADMVIRIKGNKSNIMWQKEALLNVGLKNLPNDCDKFIWIDCDLVFQNDNWVTETSALLNKYKVVQPYSLIVKTKKAEKIEDINIDKLSFGDVTGTKRYSNAYTRSKLHDRSGHPGHVWAARREVFSNIGLYDKLILGSADVIMSDAFYSPIVNMRKELNSWAMIEDQSDWCRSCFSEVQGGVTYCEGVVFHLWHGESKNRRYIERRYILKDKNFQPRIDIRKDQSGIWKWSTKKTDIVKYTESYFKLRNEEGEYRFNFSRFFKFYESNKLVVNHVFELLNLKKDSFLGKIGVIIKKISPRLYNYLIKVKPSWAEPLDI